MKAETHPDNYRQVIFLDTSSDEKFLVYSTVETEETGEYEGEEYPLYRIEISSASHPFYTGKETTIDTAGRVEKFKARFAKAREKQEELKKKSSAKSPEVEKEEKEDSDQSDNQEE